MWMIYGATGYTGQLIVEEAVKRGHQPVLAGRSEAKLKPLAEKFGLRYVVFGLSDMFTAVGGLQAAGEVELVLHAAGPFIHTAEPMRKACLQVGAHYLDITGEIAVFEEMFLYDEMARERGVVLMGGVGFDVVPTDCLARYLSEKMPDAVALDLVLDALVPSADDVGMSAGTLKSVMEGATRGMTIRRGGKLLPLDIGAGVQTFHIDGQGRSAMPISWGDVSTAYRTTGIPNITVYSMLTLEQIQAIKRIGYISSKLLRMKPLREWIGARVQEAVTGPSDNARANNRSKVYARVTNRAGETAEAILETVEAYRFTAEVSVLAVERVLAGGYKGALTPASAFGADFVLDVETTTRTDL